MKQLLLVIILFSIVSPIIASKIVVEDTSSVIISKPTIVAIPNNTTIKQILGRKLTIKEKLGLLLVRAKYKKGVPINTIEAEKANSTAVWGFVLSILGYFFFPLLIPGYILSNNALKKEKAQPGLLTDTNKTLAQIGKAFVIVYGILLVLALMLLIILIARFGMY